MKSLSTKWWPSSRRVETASCEQLQELRITTSLETESESIESIAQRIDDQFDQLIDLLAEEREQFDGHQPCVATGNSAAVATTAAATSRISIPVELAPTKPEQLELSVVVPCLNESETVAKCILRTQYAFDQLGISGEVLVADNGSTDDSVELAEQLGARVIHLQETSRANPLLASVDAARGRVVLLGSSDEKTLARWLAQEPGF